jgi:cob(I)alamin adenosyltransferase
MIFVFTGKGKGKTTAALGMGIRALGAGKKVLMIQFLKSGSSSENKVIDQLEGFDRKSFGRKGFFLPESQLTEKLKAEGVKSLKKKDKNLARKGFKIAKNSVQEYDLLILDEINLALRYNLLNLDSVIEFLREVETDLVLTGRYCPKEIIEASDLTTEMKEIKHYYNQGYFSKKGIEY